MIEFALLFLNHFKNNITIDTRICPVNVAVVKLKSNAGIGMIFELLIIND